MSKRFTVRSDFVGPLKVDDDDFGYDATLVITGDWPSAEEMIAYAEAVAKALNSAEIPTARAALSTAEEKP